MSARPRSGRDAGGAPSSTGAADAAVATGAAVKKIRVGVSSCLMGERVRWDGGHKLDRCVTDLLGAHFDLVAVCPEVEVGMGVPREPVRLVSERGNDGGIRMLGVNSALDHTEAMRSFARRRVAELAALGIRGYILKEGSPSCGMDGVRTFTTGGMPMGTGRGLFASALLEALPTLPVEEEARLGDAGLRESFIAKVFAYAGRSFHPAAHRT